MTHLELRVPTGERVRDDLRTELGAYAYGAVMLDGVSREVHEAVVINNSYYLDTPKQTQAEGFPQEEVLFAFEGAAA